MLSYYIDKTFNENFRTTAQARESLIRIANDLGFFEYGPRPSTTQVICSINVPYKLNITDGTLSPDADLLPGIESGMQAFSDSGVTFEILQEINFADPLNRVVVPNLDSNKKIIDYTISKSAPAKAGTTKLQRFYVSPSQALPFLNVTIDDVNVTEILGVVQISGNTYLGPADATFNNPNFTFFQVKNLIEQQIFVPSDPSDTSQIKQGGYIAIPKRFIARRDVNGFITLTFGSSNPSFYAWDIAIQNLLDASSLSLNQVLNNTTLGEIPAPNSTLWIKYRTGGGSNSNVTSGQINTIVSKTFFTAPSTADLTKLQKVRNSLQIRNDLPAIGGTDELSTEEIRQSSSSVFAAQNRGVTAQDLTAIIQTMPNSFGKPFRLACEEVKPMVANFDTLETQISTMLDSITADESSFSRQKKISDIKAYMDQVKLGTAFITTHTNGVVKTIPISTASTNLLGALPTLWLGEKTRIYIIGVDDNSNLTTAYKDTNGIWISPNEALKQNMQNFLSDKRVMGDWIDIIDGRVANIQIEFTVQVDKRDKLSVLSECLTKMKTYFSIDNWQMGQSIYINNVYTILQELEGVINVVDISFYNIFGTDVVSGKTYAAPETGRYRNINPLAVNTQNNKFSMIKNNNVIVGYNDTIFEVKYPDIDLIGFCL
jgi:hypothetical protein